MENNEINNEGISSQALETDKRDEETIGGLEPGGGTIDWDEREVIGGQIAVPNPDLDTYFYSITVRDAYTGEGISGFTYTVRDFYTGRLISGPSTSNRFILQFETMTYDRITVLISKSGYAPLESAPITGTVGTYPKSPENLQLTPNATPLSVSLKQTQVSIPRTGGSAVVGYTINSGSLNTSASGISSVSPVLTASLDTNLKTITINVPEEVSEGSPAGNVRVRFTDAIFGTEIYHSITVFFVDVWIKPDTQVINSTYKATTTSTYIRWTGLQGAPSITRHSSFITPTFTTVESGVGLLELDIAENTESEVRTGYVDFSGTSSDGNTVLGIVNVNQGAAPSIPRIQISVKQSTFPNYSDSYEIEYELISGEAYGSKVKSTPVWVSRANTYNTIGKVGLTLKENTEASDRSGNIIISLYDLTYSEWVDFNIPIKQYGSGAVVVEYFPAWRDVYYDFPYSTTFTISTGKKTIFTGNAVLNPSTGIARINVASILRNYMSSVMNFSDDIVQNKEDKEFTLYSSTGEILARYIIHNDWSYDRDLDYHLPEDNGYVLSDPINRHFDPRMYLLFTTYTIGKVDWTYTIAHEGSTEVFTYRPDTSDFNFTNTVILKGAGPGADSVVFENKDGFQGNKVSYDVPKCGTGDSYSSRYAIYYRNRKGGYDSFLIEGGHTKKDSYNKSNYITTYNNNNPLDFGTRNYHKDITTTLTLYTGWLSDSESEKLSFNLLPSTEIYIHDLEEGTIKSAIITNSSADYKTFKSNGRKLVNYELTITESQLTTFI